MLLMATILERIVASKREELEESRRRAPMQELERRLGDAPPVRDFRAALEKPPGIQLIAEVKRASPSAGEIRTDVDVLAVAAAYEGHGAACISVLTDGPYFHGSLEDLRRIRPAVGLPLLRKDFVLDEYQVMEARAAGADAVLLIAEILDDLALTGLIESVRRLGMEALVEFFAAENLPRVLRAGANLIGINNRNLHTFQTSLEQTIALAREVPRQCLVVSESGIRTRADVERLEAAGAKAILVGETLMRSADAGAKVRELIG
jgi:indole-3-glycerol phosphate synthase